jgi:hypothetical protein
LGCIWTLQLRTDDDLRDITADWIRLILSRQTHAEAYLVVDVRSRGDCASGKNIAADGGAALLNLARRVKTMLGC